MSAPKIVVKQPTDGAEISVEVLADSIIQISNAMKKINSSRLNRRALVTLLNDSSGVGRRDIEFVLNHLGALEKTFCVPSK